jgi:hypothetical protein
MKRGDKVGKISSGCWLPKLWQLLNVMSSCTHNLSKSCSVQNVIPWTGVVLEKCSDVLLVRKFPGSYET